MSAPNDSGVTIYRIDDQTPIERGGGVKTIPLAGAGGEAAGLSTGISIFAPGTSIRLHTHNVEESITLLEGDAECEVEGVRTRLKPFDTTHVRAGVPHRFINVGSGVMKILWSYPSLEVTRTFMDTGETQGHLGRYE